MNVFVSVRRTYTDSQEGFVRAFEKALTERGCTRLTVGRGNYGAQQPIERVRQHLVDADACVVIAFGRYELSGVECPGSTVERPLSRIRLPTVWNQLEAAMAYGLRVPILVILEKALHQEAMLKDRYEFRVQTTELAQTYFESVEFRDVFADFERIARERSARGRRVDAEALTLRDIFLGMKPSTLGVLMSALVVALASAVALGSKFPEILQVFADRDRTPAAQQSAAPDEAAPRR